MEAKNDAEWMREALREAQLAFEEGEVPVGAVVVDQGRLIGRGHNRIENLKDATAHAEIIAIGAASAARGDWRLEGATLYVTVEPCMMCLGAIFLSRVSRLVFGTYDKRAGACGGAIPLGSSKYMDRELSVSGGVLESGCQELLLEFFSKVRQSGKA
ncbi:MAG: nucleoside deaminase [Candidatus Eisenbacteria bacterium]